VGGGTQHVGRERLTAGRRVVVIGGGLAGIAAALDCADAGARVTLVEVRRRLGGAAYSFERDGLRIDNGQHVFLRCCSAYRALLARLGSERRVSVQPRLEIPVLSPGSETVVLRRSALPAPLHLALALARYPHLTPAQRFGAARAALALTRLDPHEEALDRQTFGDWLARHGQGPEAVSALWDLIALPTLNLPAAQASLQLGAFVFHTGLLASADAGDIGFHTRTLSETIGEPAARALAEAGVEVRLGWRAERLEEIATGFEIHGRGGRGGGGKDGEERVRESGEESTGGGDRTAGRGDDDGAENREGAELSAEAVIVAVPHTRAAALLEPLIPEVARKVSALGSSPIVNLHVIYDRPVCDLPFAAGVRTPVQYLFDRTAAAGAPAGCQYLAVSLSGAEREMGMSVDALRERYLPALRDLLPRARNAKVERFLVTREHAATFRAAPGVAVLRPGPTTSVPGLVLAGAWTATGWPATLEGAVLSGHAAADSALRALGIEPASGSAPGTAAAGKEATSAGTPTGTAAP
jgi:protoporphyrinogen oxidase